MVSELPYAVEAEMSMDYDELEVLRLEYEREESEGFVSTQTRFNYAWGLLKSPRREDQTQGVKMMQKLFDDAPNYRRECLYYISLGFYKLGDYEKAQVFNQRLLDKEPDNPQGRSLETLIENKLQTEGYVGMGIAAGAALLVSGIAWATLRRASRK